jgi:hypothetical protein
LKRGIAFDQPRIAFLLIPKNYSCAVRFNMPPSGLCSLVALAVTGVVTRKRARVIHLIAQRIVWIGRDRFRKRPSFMSLYTKAWLR